MNTRVIAKCLPVLAIVWSAGCASTEPKPQFQHEMVADSRIALPDTVQVNVAAPDSVAILPAERERLGQEIKSRIDAKKASHPGLGEGRSYEVDLQLSRYDKGSSFARAMLAGLGQIHINGKVSVYQTPAHSLVGEFDIAKTFAWGGIYGSSTSMQDIEVAFANGIADAVTGQDRAQSRPKEALSTR